MACRQYCRQTVDVGCVCCHSVLTDTMYISYNVKRCICQSIDKQHSARNKGSNEES